MKTVELNVKLTFDDSICGDKEILEIMENVARAIENETNGMGIAPEEGEAVTDIIEVSCPYIEDKVTRDLRLF